VFFADPPQAVTKEKEAQDYITHCNGLNVVSAKQGNVSGPFHLLSIRLNCCTHLEYLLHNFYPNTIFENQNLSQPYLCYHVKDKLQR
jgi:hypothetical protein